MLLLPLLLQVGVRHALQLSAQHQLPWVPVHHMEAHALMAAMPGVLQQQQLQQGEVAAAAAAAAQPSMTFPALLLLASGGHNMLVSCCCLSFGFRVVSFALLLFTGKLLPSYQDSGLLGICFCDHDK
jgi:hypothetical protein